MTKIKKYGCFINEEMTSGEIEILTIRKNGSYFAHVTKRVSDGVYITHGALGDGTEYQNCEKLFKYISEFGDISFDDIYWK